MSEIEGDDYLEFLYRVKEEISSKFSSVRELCASLVDRCVDDIPARPANLQSA